jgi:SAM-dependent methyltransferase
MQRFRTSGRRAGLRFDAEHGVATEALLFLGQLDPEAIGPGLAYATHYEPTPVADFERLLAHVAAPFATTRFVDLGAGLGRVVLLAAQRPFLQVVGVEISPALLETARENLATFDPALLHCRDVRLVRKDAINYAFPPGNLVVYLFNPFLAPALARRAGDVWIIYHTPAERAIIDATGAFDIVAEEPPGIVYRLKRPPSFPRR